MGMWRIATYPSPGTRFYRTHVVRGDARTIGDWHGSAILSGFRTGVVVRGLAYGARVSVTQSVITPEMAVCFVDDPTLAADFAEEHTLPWRPFWNRVCAVYSGIDPDAVRAEMRRTRAMVATPRRGKRNDEASLRAFVDRCPQLPERIRQVFD